MTGLIRALGPEDRGSILEIYGELKREYAFPLGADWTPEKLKKELVAAKGFGHFEHNFMNAFVLYRNTPEAREITLLATRKTAQGRGLMRELLSYFLKLNPQKVWLEVHAENTPAISLYKGLGFVEQGVRKSYYKDGKDAILCEYNSLQ